MFERPRFSVRVVIPLGTLLVITTVCVLGPHVLHIPPPFGGSIIEANLPAGSPGHLLGTDQNGNDVFSRLLYGGRASLGIALAVNVIGLAVGGTLGAASALLGGVSDLLLMRALDVLVAFPQFVLALAIAEALGSGETSTIVALVLLSVPAFARVSRALALSLRERPFILAAKLSGTGFVRTLFRHVGSNILQELVGFALLGMGISILLEGGLSFLGLGIPAPLPSWGNMISLGQQVFVVRPYLFAAPSILLFATVLSLNLLGEALRERGYER
jgi:peptide/nickel transport system permease protein